MAYLMVIVGCNFLFAALHAWTLEIGYFYALGVSAIATVYVIAIDGATAGIVRLMPAKYFSHESKLYTVGAQEKRFYERLKIRKWKDHVPDLGHATGFRKNKIADPKNPAYLERFLLEIAYGEMGHALSVLTGALIIIPIFPFTGWVQISAFVCAVSAVLNVLPVFVLRYNSYKLKILLKRLKTDS